MGPFTKKSKARQLLDKVSSPRDLSSGLRSGLPSEIKPGLPASGAGKALTAGVIAVGGLAGLTAASAGISSLRRREEAGGD